MKGVGHMYVGCTAGTAPTVTMAHTMPAEAVGKPVPWMWDAVPFTSPNRLSDVTVMLPVVSFTYTEPKLRRSVAGVRAAHKFEREKKTYPYAVELVLSWLLVSTAKPTLEKPTCAGRGE